MKKLIALLLTLTVLLSFAACGAQEPEVSGETVEFTPVKLSFGDGFELLNEYASEQKYVKRDFSAPPEPGWNSWDYYRWTVTEKEVLKNHDKKSA